MERIAYPIIIAVALYITAIAASHVVAEVTVLMETLTARRGF